MDSKILKERLGFVFISIGVGVLLFSLWFYVPGSKLSAYNDQARNHIKTKVYTALYQKNNPIEETQMYRESVQKGDEEMRFFDRNLDEDLETAKIARTKAKNAYQFYSMGIHLTEIDVEKKMQIARTTFQKWDKIYGREKLRLGILTYSKFNDDITKAVKMINEFQTRR